MLAVIGFLIMAFFFLIVLGLVFGIAIAIGDFLLSLLDNSSKVQILSLVGKNKL